MGKQDEEAIEAKKKKKWGKGETLEVTNKIFFFMFFFF